MYKGKSRHAQHRSRLEALTREPRPGRKGGARGKPGRAPRRLLQARARDEIVLGQVSGVRKGGFRIKCGGSTCFCPASQIDLVRPRRPEAWVGREARFLVLRVHGADVILSRRALLERERDGRLHWCRRCCDEGYAARGRVVSLGASRFRIDLRNRVYGTLAGPELSAHGELLAAAYRKGDEVLVRIESVDGNHVRVSLEMLPPRVAREPTPRQLRGRVVRPERTRST